jgi:transketolase
VIEAALRQPWDRLLNEGDGFVGMDDFGASAPIADLYEHFNITSSAVAKLAVDLAN